MKGIMFNVLQLSLAFHTTEIPTRLGSISARIKGYPNPNNWYITRRHSTIHTGEKPERYLEH
jgi:hypothetical protein